MQKLFITIYLFACLTMFNFSSAEPVEIGRPAPGFQLTDQLGKTHTLNDYKGRWLVLYFYPKDDTPGCTKQACAFRDDYRTISAQNTQVLGISVDNQASHAKFAQKYQLPFPLLADKNGLIASRYQSLTSLGPLKLAKRHTFIIGPAGNVQMIYRKVDVNNHSRQVLSALKKLQAEKMY